jgi:hypothetical protein
MADQPATPGENTNQPVASAETPATPVVTPAAPASATPATPASVTPAAASTETPAKPAPAAAATTETPAEPAKPAEPAAPDLNTVPDAYQLVADAATARPVDPTLVEAVAPILKDAKVTSAQAQKLVDAFQAHQKAAMTLRMQADLDALRADPELGKLNFARTQQRVNDALAAFTLPAERAALDAMGIANNPTLVRMFHRIGAAMQEAPQTDAGLPAPMKLPTEKKLYGGRDLVTSKPN